MLEGSDREVGIGCDFGLDFCHLEEHFISGTFFAGTFSAAAGFRNGSAGGRFDIDFDRFTVFFDQESL